MKPPVDAIVIGAGHNGLIAGTYLARAGMTVNVLEQRPFVGGACVTEEIIPGYRFSTCAAVCWKLQQKIVDDLGLAKRVRYARLDPDPINLYDDHLALPVWTDARRTAAEVSRFNARDGERYLDWRSFWNAASDIFDRFFLQPPPSAADLESYAQASGASDVLDRLRRTSLGEICASFFEDERTRAAFINVDDVGDPWAAEGGLLEAYFQSQGAFGNAFIVGGMGALTQAIAEVARDAGVAISTDVTVTRVLVDANGVEGVELSDGRELRADVVVSNADPLRTIALAGADASVLSDGGTAATRSTASCIKFHGVLDAAPDLTAYFAGVAVPRHGQLRIAPSLENYRRGHEAAQQGEMPEEPVVHLHLPTPYDSSLASGDGQCVSGFVRNAPYVLANGGWERRKAAVGQQIVDYVDRFVPRFRSSLQELVLFSPADIERRVGLTNGNIHHVDMVPSQLFDGRLAHRTKISGLFLCGSGTHPGGEVTGAPGYNAAKAILDAGPEVHWS